jgi:hypothetical protein
MATVEEVERSHRDYVLAAYSAHDLAAYPEFDRGRLYSAYPASSFFGTQSVYFPAVVLPDVASYMRKHGVDEPRAPGDLILRDFCHERQFLLGARSSLVQHIGQVSTGLGNFHSAAGFADDRRDAN